RKLEPAAVGRDEVARERETQPRPGPARDLPLEDARGEVVVDALTVVADLEDRAVARSRGPRTHPRGPRAVLEGVLDEGREHLGQRPGCREHVDVRLDLELERAARGLEGGRPLLDLLLGELEQVDRLGRAALLLARVREEVVDDVGETLDLLEGDAGLL